MYTKNSIKATLTLMVNLVEQTQNLRDELCKALSVKGMDALNEALFDLLREVQDGSRTDVDDVMREIDELSLLHGLPDGTECTPFRLKVTNVCDAELQQPLPDGGELVAWVGVSDYDTRQAGMMFCAEDGTLFDIALAEQRRGELAEIVGLPENNQDIDLHVYNDVYSDDWTDKFRIGMEDIENALGESEANE